MRNCNNPRLALRRQSPFFLLDTWRTMRLGYPMAYKIKSLDVHDASRCQCAKIGLGSLKLPNQSCKAIRMGTAAASPSAEYDAYD
ncbi:MAG: hypothetical protein NVSMB9_15180 [Isosphaeraceae bacterium]